MDHSYEEIRSVIIDILAGRENTSYDCSQFAHLKIGVAEVFARRDGTTGNQHRHSITGGRDAQLSPQDRELTREIFWDLFRQGVIMIGADDANEKFPFFSVTTYGKRIIEGGDPYFSYDVDSYERRIKTELPSIDDTTLIYLKEAMQAFRSGCVLSSSVMLGVATEHTFLLLAEAADQSPTYSQHFASVSQQFTILRKVNKFKNILDQHTKDIPADIREDIDTHFTSILSVIRNFRNQAGHPTGKVLNREQAFVLLQLFIPYCKKLYALSDWLKTT
jgi:hypothetical protein